MPVGVELEAVGVDRAAAHFTDDHLLRILAVAVDRAAVATLKTAVAVSALALPGGGVPCVVRALDAVVISGHLI